ncbi:hypothetical protein QOT17_013790 [Balamuthia mandrillaris]
MATTTTTGPPHLLPHHQDILCPSTNTPAANAQRFSILVISVNLATAKQEFMEAVPNAWEIQDNVELAALDLNSLLHSGNAPDSLLHLSSSGGKVPPPSICECHHTIISHINNMEIMLGDRSTTCVTRHAAHILINCDFCKLHHHFFIMLLQGEYEILFKRDMASISRLVAG